MRHLPQPLTRRRQALAHALIPVLCALLTLVVVLRRLIFSPGYVIYRDLFPGQLHYPYLWHPQGSFLALENYKFITFTGLFLPLRALGLDVYEKGVYVSAMGVAYLSVYLAAFRLLGQRAFWADQDRSGSTGSPPSARVRHLASGLAGLTYVANPAAANVFFDFSLFVGYAFAPLIFWLFIEMLSGRRRPARTVVAIALLWWLSAIKAHWIVFGGLLLVPPLLIWTIQHKLTPPSDPSHRSLRQNLAATGAIVALYLLLSAYWLIPFLRASQERFVGSYAPINLQAISFLSNAPLRAVVRLLGTFQAWPYVRFEPPAPLLGLPWNLASWAIPALVTAALLWFRRHWQVWTLAVFALGGIFLAKGVAPPLGEAYVQLVFGDLTPDPFRWLFRVASKWNVFVSLGYSLLIPFALAKAMTRVRWSSWTQPWDDSRSAVALLTVAGYVLALPFFAWPSFTGDFDGALVPVELPEPLTRANRWLAQQPDDAKVNWMPVTNGRELSWNQRPSGGVYTSLSPKPSIGTGWNRHPVLYYSYAYDALAKEQTAHFGKLLSLLNTRFVAYHDDVTTSHIHQGVEPVAVLIESGERELTDQLDKQADVHLAWQDDFLSIYEIPQAAAPLFVPRRVFWAADDLNRLTSLSALPGWHPAQDALLFDASRHSGTLPLMTSGSRPAINGLLLGHDAADHLALALLPAERLLAPANETYQGAASEGWARFDVYQFDWQFLLRDYGIQHWGFDYGQGIAAHIQAEQASDHPRLSLSVRAPRPDTYQLWVRHLRHPKAAELLVSVDGQPQATLAGDHPITGFVWQEAGTVELAAGQHTIGLQNEAGLAAVNALALIPQDDMADLRQRSQALAAQLPNLYLLEAETDFGVPPSQVPPGAISLSAGQAVVVDAGRPISTNLDLVTSGDYTVAVRTFAPTRTTPLTLTLGSHQLQLKPQPQDTDMVWLSAGPVRLDEETVPIQIQAADAVVVDAFILYTDPTTTLPEGLFPETSLPAEISYERIDPTRYRVRVQAKGPFMLALAETYDPLWVASGPDVNASSVPLYGVINGFFIDRPGSYELTVEYQAQQWARFGTLFTAVVFIGLGGLLLFLRQR